MLERCASNKPASDLPKAASRLAERSFVPTAHCWVLAATVWFRTATRRCMAKRMPSAPQVASRSYRDLILVTTLAPCWYCTGLIYQFRFKQVIVGDSVNAQGGVAWLREKGFDILDLASPECIEMLGEFQRTNRETLERVRRRRLRRRRVKRED